MGSGNAVARRFPLNSTDMHICPSYPLERLQAFTSANPSIPTSTTPDYTAKGYTKCRLVVERGDQRSNSAAHVRIGGASCNDLAVIEVQGVAGYVSLAVAGDNLRALVDALSGLVTARETAPTGVPDNAGDSVVMSERPETGAA